jgi:hypothetical protein
LKHQAVEECFPIRDSRATTQRDRLGSFWEVRQLLINLVAIYCIGNLDRKSLGNYACREGGQPFEAISHSRQKASVDLISPQRWDKIAMPLFFRGG